MNKQLLSVKLSLALLLAGLSAFSQTTFVRRVGSAHSDFGTSCSPTQDGGTIMTVESSTNGMDLHSGLVRYDANGVMQWYKTYQVGQYTISSTALETDDGYMVFAYGTDSSYVNNNNHYIVLYKTDNTGTAVWNKQYSFSGNDISINMVRRKMGGYIGFTLSDYNIGVYPKTTVTRFDDFGNTVWSKQFTGAYGLSGTRGIEMPNGNICFIATAADPNNNFFLDVIVTMLDSGGSVIWSKNFGTYYDDEPYALAANTSNEVFVTGRGYFMNSNWDSFLLRIDHNGNLVTSMGYDAGTPDGEIMRCIVALGDGTFRLLGDMGTFNERDIVMLNIDSNLAVSAAHRYTFSPLFTNYPYDIYQATDGGFVFTGDYRPPAAYRDAILTKTERDGNLSCYAVAQQFTSANVSLHDTLYAIIPVIVSTTTLNYPDNSPNNPFFDHMECALSTGVEDQSDFAGSVFPNPVHDIIRVKLSGTETNGEIRIMNMEGRVVFEEKFSGIANRDIDVKEFAQGVYVVRILTDDSSKASTFIKE